MDKYLHKYVYLKNGHCFYVKDIVGGKLKLYDRTNNRWLYGFFQEPEIDHIADEVCPAVTVE